MTVAVGRRWVKPRTIMFSTYNPLPIDSMPEYLAFNVINKNKILFKTVWKGNLIDCLQKNPLDLFWTQRFTAVKKPEYCYAPQACVAVELLLKMLKFWCLKKITKTCLFQPHESRTMEAHNDDESQPASASVRLSEPSVHPRTTIMTTAMRQLSTVSDADSAISSAPASLSPQPTSCPNSPEVWRAHPGHDHQQQQLHLQSLRDQSQLAEIKLELDRMQAKYDLLSADYGKAKDQIDTLERELLEVGIDQHVFTKESLHDQPH